MTATSESLRTECENLNSKIQSIEESRRHAEEKGSENLERMITEKSRLEKDIEERESTIQSIQEALETKDNVR